MKVVVTGATGFLGVPIVERLLARGDAVTALVRDVERARPKLPGATLVAADLESHGAWEDALVGADAIVHLAGEPIAGKRWDARQKQVIRDSRVEATRTLVEALVKLPPITLVSASGIDYYPFAVEKDEFDDDEVTEKDAPSDSFLGRLCRDWEKEAREAPGRVVCMRTGVVLAKGGGALEKMVPAFRKFVGGKLGSGKQFFSWIHRDDAVAAYLAAIDDARYVGPINLVADSTRFGEFAKALGHALHRPAVMRVPGFAVKAMFGELAESLLHGRRAVPAALRSLGFTFRYPDLPSALAELS